MEIFILLRQASLSSARIPRFNERKRAHKFLCWTYRSPSMHTFNLKHRVINKVNTFYFVNSTIMHRSDAMKPRCPVASSNKDIRVINPVNHPGDTVRIEIAAIRRYKRSQPSPLAPVNSLENRRR